jgi:hypothetical protein
VAPNGVEELAVTEEISCVRAASSVGGGRRTDFRRHAPRTGCKAMSRWLTRSGYHRNRRSMMQYPGGVPAGGFQRAFVPSDFGTVQQFDSWQASDPFASIERITVLRVVDAMIMPDPKLSTCDLRPLKTGERCWYARQQVGNSRRTRQSADAGCRGHRPRSVAVSLRSGPTTVC